LRIYDGFSTSHFHVAAINQDGNGLGFLRLTMCLCEG